MQACPTTKPPIDWAHGLASWRRPATPRPPIPSCLATSRPPECSAATSPKPCTASAARGDTEWPHDRKKIRTRPFQPDPFRTDVLAGFRYFHFSRRRIDSGLYRLVDRRLVDRVAFRVPCRARRRAACKDGRGGTDRESPGSITAPYPGWSREAAQSGPFHERFGTGGQVNVSIRSRRGERVFVSAEPVHQAQDDQ